MTPTVELLLLQDSPATSVRDMVTADNPSASVSPVDNAATSPSTSTGDILLQPLIVDKSSSAERPDSTRSSRQTDDTRQADDIGTADDIADRQTTALLGKTASNMSLDSYDKTLNPFFS